MSRLKLAQLDSIDQLRAVAPAWDDLWLRSRVSLSTARAELVALWLEQFAPNAKIRVLTVQDAGQLVAALPLVGRRLRGVLPVGDLSMNYWSPNGELLSDPAADVDAVMDVLADGLAKTPWPLLWLDLVPLEQPRWRALCAALERRGLAWEVHTRYRIGEIEIDGPWEDCESRLSRNLRRSLRKDSNRLERAGGVQLKHYADLSPGEVEDRLREAFEIEDRGWKGGAGGSVFRTPGLFEFYCRQSRQLAEWGSLRLFLLEHKGAPIAFEWGWTAKGVYHSFKVGYDPAFGRYSPGQLLRMHLVRSFCEQSEPMVIDFQGPLTEALSSWSTRSYPICRLVIAPHGPTSRALLAAYRYSARLLRRWRRPRREGGV